MWRVQQHEFVDLAPRARRRPQVDRRGFLKAAATLAATTAMAPAAFARNFEPGAEPTRYPDPDIVVLDKRFASTSSATRRSSACTPACCGPRARPGTASADTCSGATSPTTSSCAGSRRTATSASFRNPAGNSNGNTFDYEGRQISCEHGNRRVVRYEHNGKVTVLADKFDGKPLNAPNDAVVHPRRRHLVHRPRLRQPDELRRATRASLAALKEAVYRIDAQDGKIEKVDRRHLQAQRPLLLARLQEALRRRHRRLALRRSAQEHQGLGRRRRQEAGERPRVRSSMEHGRRKCRLRRRHPRRRGRQHLGQRRLGRRRLRRRPRLRPRRRRASARSCCRRSAATSASAAPSATACS